MKAETNLQNKIRCELSKYGVVLRWNSGVMRTEDGRTITIGLKGVSDLLFIGNGYIAWIEVKVGKNKPSTEQLNFIKRMQELNHIAGVVYSVEDALKLCKINPHIDSQNPKTYSE